MLLRIAAGIVCLLALAPCQSGQNREAEGEEDVRSAEAARSKAKAALRAEKGEKPDAEEENLTPEQRLARNVTNGASAYCRFAARLMPAKLMPGESGMLRVVATLQGHAVLPAPAQIEVLSTPEQGPISLGVLSSEPAELGRLEKGYLNRPVYENYAVFHMPVTMAANAELGKKHVVAVDMKFDLYDGTSAQAIGRFVDRVATEVEVGRVPDPAVAARARNGQVDPTPTPPATAPGDTPAKVEPAAAAVPALQGHALPPTATAPQGAPSDAPPPESSSPQPVLEDEGGAAMPMIVVGGVLALVLVLLLLRKK
jgi:hypothetical protein